MSLPPLAPLRIPHGWYVAYNQFFEIQPLVQDGKLVQPECFQKTLLLLEYMVPEGREDKFLIDLGWVPAESPSGRFRLALLLRDWNTVVTTIWSSDYREIQQKVDTWLKAISSSVGLSEAMNKLQNG